MGALPAADRTVRKTPLFMKLSVIVCTHNPRRDYLARTVTALREQTLSTSEWELVVVDNASFPALELTAQLAWHPAARTVSEPVLGLVAARLRGIEAASGDWLVFVDDDNLLAPDYLATAAALQAQWPVLGAFGGQNRGEFETAPTPWFAARLDRLAIREFSSVTRTHRHDPALAPCGAGLCVKAAVARRYRKNAFADSRRLALGREGSALFSGDDIDLALTACDLGLEMGRFPSLQLIHLIPSTRLTLQYFARITRSHARGQLRLLSLRPALEGHRQATWAARRALWKWTVIDTVLSLRATPRSAP
jgi:GT2 family glycosyltransferase